MESFARFASLNSISAFKRYLSINDPVVPTYSYLGDRIPQIIDCKLRINMSDLQSDMFNRHTKTATVGIGMKMQTIIY